MKQLSTALFSLLLCYACQQPSGNANTNQENDTAKQLLQGIWVDEETEMVLMHIEGDTIFYADPINVPAAFKIVHDTIYVYSNEPVAYKIDRQTEYSFWFHTLENQMIKLRKSDNEEDSLAFIHREVEVIPTIPQVIQKDSVVTYNHTRYRGYVYINPSSMKVIHTSYSENGYSVDNIYYDNVIHICVYEGRTLLYGQDITKKDFTGIFPEEYLKQVVLSNMDFMGVDAQGYHYRATIHIPESSVYNFVNLAIDFHNQLKIEKAD